MYHLQQGMMCGYATDETDELIPLTLKLAHQLNQKLEECRKNESLPWVRPDCKSQVSNQTLAQRTQFLIEL